MQRPRHHRHYRRNCGQPRASTHGARGQYVQTFLRHLLYKRKSERKVKLKRQFFCLFVHFVLLLHHILYIRRFRGNILFGAFTSCCNRLRESFRATKLRNVPRKSPRHDRKSVCRGETLKLVKEFFPNFRSIVSEFAGKDSKFLSTCVLFCSFLAKKIRKRILYRKKSVH